MKKNPKVTIIIPVYNGSNYVEDAIKTALNQTYENLEIIVVNDGSNDNGATKKIAESYLPRIKYLEKENGGVSTALNLGIKNMTGDYFSWLSHDDMYYPNKIEKEVEELLKYDDHTILYSNFDLVDKNGEKMTFVYLDHDMLTKKPDYAVLRGAIGGITLLIPKKAFEECGYFDESLRCVQDYELWFQMSMKYKFVHLTDILAMTRIHGMQDSNTSPKMLSEGNWLWKHMTVDYPVSKKIEYEGSEYLFYKEMGDYLDLSTPYEQARDEVLNIALDILKKEKDKLNDKNVTVVVLDSGSSKNLDKTIDSIKAQTFKNVEIIIEGSSKRKGIINTSDRKDTLMKIETDFYSFLSAGVIVDEKWLENQILELIVTNKALAISDFDKYNKDSLIDNLDILHLIPIDGIVFNNKFKVQYEDNLSYCYSLVKVGGSFVTVNKYMKDVPLIDSYTSSVEYLKLLVASGDYTDYQLASLCYNIACFYNDGNSSGKKVYMYHPCAKYEDLSNSRSFKLLEKYMNFKKKIRKH